MHVQHAEQTQKERLEQILSGWKVKRSIIWHVQGKAARKRQKEALSWMVNKPGEFILRLWGERNA